MIRSENKMTIRRSILQFGAARTRARVLLAPQPKRAFQVRATPLILLAVAVSAGLCQQAKAQSISTDLQDASSFAVLGTTINFGSGDTITGDIGASTISGSPLVLNGVDQANGSATQAGQTALSTAYNAAARLTPTESLTGQDLGGLTLTPGVYSFSAAAQLTGTLTLNGAGVYIFQIGSTLTTAVSSGVNLTGGAQASDVFWAVGSAATLGATNSFEGDILANTAINVGSDTMVHGGLLGAAVTLTSGDTVLASVPEPADTSLLIAGFAGLIIGIRKIRMYCASGGANLVINRRFKPKLRS